MLPLPLIKKTTWALLATLWLCTLPPASAQPAGRWVFSSYLPAPQQRWIGLAPDGKGGLFASDADANAVVQIHPGGMIDTLPLEGERPMHMSFREIAGIPTLMVACYGSDHVWVYQPGTGKSMTMPMETDGCAGVDAAGTQMAVADFYNHSLFFPGKPTVQRIGAKGHGKGQMEYPTDVQFEDGLWWVADAYNHRVQAFDPSGKPRKVFGHKDDMRAATGIFVQPEGPVFVTDFENSRVLVYSRKGKLLQILTEGLEKPSDALVMDGKLYVTNNHGKQIGVYLWEATK